MKRNLCTSHLIVAFQCRLSAILIVVQSVEQLQNCWASFYVEGCCMTHQVELCSDDIIAISTFQDAPLLDNDSEDSM